MPDSQFTTQQAAFRLGSVLITSLALSKLRLVKSTITPGPFTTKDQLTAAEADFSGYTAGGYVLTAWTGPGFGPGSAAQITSPLVHVAWAAPEDPPEVGNTIGAWWVEDATGNVRQVGVFDPPRPMSAAGHVIDFVDQIVVGANV